MNTDNRLVSATDMAEEFEFLTHKGFELSDLRAVTVQALDSAFCDDETRERVRADVLAGYQA